LEAYGKGVITTISVAAPNEVLEKSEAQNRIVLVQGFN
jgi:hypothetical protein